jgi:putative Mg2+ transporter-C (MgtC) family protein
MPLTLAWQQIALRLTCAFAAGILIGINRDEKGRPAGMRTTVLVCLAACIAMIQANLLMNTAGKPPDSFVVLDLMRLPLGILSGIGFIGAGAILRKGDMVMGVTTAATIWLVTVIGLCIGGGQIWLGAAGVVLALGTLWGLKWLEHQIDHQHRGKLTVRLNESVLPERDLRIRLQAASLHIHSWSMSVSPDAGEKIIECELRWQHRSRDPFPPEMIRELPESAGVIHLSWQG